jgi:putative colanic acid biosynthesis acetyltransferase WcaF
MERRTNPAAFRNPHGRANRVARLVWGVVWALLFRPTPWFMGAWRTFLLRRFGARIKWARFHSTVRVWAPWRLEIGEHVWVDERVYLYNVFGLTLGDRIVISQGAFLCGASHDYTVENYPLTGGRIRVEGDSWITAEAFVAPGVTIGRGTVVGARAVVLKDTPAWTVVAGNPARVIKEREVRAAATGAADATTPETVTRPPPAMPREGTP